MLIHSIRGKVHGLFHPFPTLFSPFSRVFLFPAIPTGRLGRALTVVHGSPMLVLATATPFKASFSLKGASMIAKNTICLWYDGAALEAATFYAATFPDSHVKAVHHAPDDFPGGKKGDILTVEFAVLGIPCLGLNGGPTFRHSEAFSFQVSTADQSETDRLWQAIVGNGGQESACGWCKDKWGLSWQITPRALIEALNDSDPAAAQRAFAAMMTMGKIDIAAIETARRGARALPH